METKSDNQVSPGIRLIEQVPLGIRSSDSDNTIREDRSDLQVALDNHKHLRNGLVLKDRKKILKQIIDSGERVCSNSKSLIIFLFKGSGENSIFFGQASMGIRNYLQEQKTYSV